MFLINLGWILNKDNLCNTKDKIWSHFSCQSKGVQASNSFPGSSKNFFRKSFRIVELIVWFLTSRSDVRLLKAWSTMSRIKQFRISKVQNTVSLGVWLDLRKKKKTYLGKPVTSCPRSTYHHQKVWRSALVSTTAQCNKFHCQTQIEQWARQKATKPSEVTHKDNASCYLG